MPSDQTHPAALRIVVTGDVHLDHGRWGITNPRTGRNTAWESAAECWQAICSHAIDNQADLVVVVGDLFLNGRPSAEACELAADGLRRLNQAGVPAILVRGNHELIGVRLGHRGPLERYRDLPNVTVVDEPAIVTHHTGLQVVAIPWPRRNEILAAANGPSPRDAADADKIVSNWIAEQIDKICRSDIDTDTGPVICAAHVAVAEATLRGSEHQLWGTFNEPLVPRAAVSREPFSHVALGHIHLRQHLDDRTHYLGSPDRIDFSEEHHPKSFSELHIATDGSTRLVDQPTPARRLLTIDATKPARLDTALAIAEAAPDDAIVRLLIPANDHEIEPAVRHALNPAARLARTQVIAATATATEPARDKLSEDIDVIDGLRRWLKTRGEPSDRIDKLVDAARNLNEAAGD